MKISGLIFLSFLASGAAAYAACRIASMFDAAFDLNAPANDNRALSNTRSQRVVRKEHSRWTDRNSSSGRSSS